MIVANLFYKLANESKGSSEPINKANYIRFGPTLDDQDLTRCVDFPAFIFVLSIAPITRERNRIIDIRWQ